MPQTSFLVGTFLAVSYSKPALEKKRVYDNKNVHSGRISTHFGILHVMWSIFEYKVFYEIGLWVNLLVKSIKNMHPLHTVSFSQF